MSPRRKLLAGTPCAGAPYRGSASFLAVTSPRVERSAAACALPRPSAIASAKLANSTVSHSQAEIEATKRKLWPPTPGCNSRSTAMALVSTLPTKTTNITGFFSCRRGSSLRTLSSSAVPSSRRSNSVRVRPEVPAISVRLQHLQLLDYRAERQRRHEIQRANQQHGTDQHDNEHQRVRGQSAGAGRHGLLLREAPGDSEHRHQQPVTRQPHRDAERDIIKRSVDIQPGEGAAIVIASRGEGIKNLREAVRARVGDAGDAGRCRDRDGRADQ